MNIKQIVGLVVAVIGIFLIGYGSYSKSHVATARNEIHKIAESKNPIVKSIGKDMEEKVGEYGNMMNLSLFGGAVLVVLGLGAVYFYRKPKKK